MATATGIGGVFVRAKDPEALYAWYEKNLGLKREHGSFMFPAAQQRSKAVVSFFKRDSDYFPVAQPVMLNFQVDDLDGVLALLRSNGARVDEKVDKSDFGNFGWFTDPEGNRVELFQPPA